MTKAATRKKKKKEQSMSGIKLDLLWVKGLGMPEDPKCLLSGEESDL